MILARAGQRASRGPPSTASSTSSGGGAAGAAGALLAGVAGAGRGLFGRPLSLQPRGPPPLVPLEDMTAASVAAIPAAERADGDAETEPLVPPAGPPGGPATPGPGATTRRVSLQMPNLAGIAEDPSSPPLSRPTRPPPPSQDESSV